MISKYLEQFYRSIFVYLGLFRSIFGCLSLSLAMSGYLPLWLSLATSSHIWVYLVISGYLWLSRPILDYLWLSRAILGYLRLISDYLRLILDYLRLSLPSLNYQDASRIRKEQVIAILNFFIITFFFSHLRFLEELALLKKECMWNYLQGQKRRKLIFGGDMASSAEC